MHRKIINLNVDIDINEIKFIDDCYTKWRGNKPCYDAGQEIFTSEDMEDFASDVISELCFLTDSIKKELEK